ncbi:hypothetical protein G6034_17945 [Arthrobacter sp. AETb3-4]|uniref:Uncharacterized protein n=1 Tax=Arthrobacter wenxiniae TaxID=2713570 RepID=A0A7Y7IKV9_9MICC|nr:hypothetical protein [Arthrobacter sp. A2-55]MCU6479550.1 hypothetical protein [Arthrobacter sp. A2-55]NVM96751.1 hypothetical protein [Arthrobacter wenxiniae]
MDCRQAADSDRATPGISAARAGMRRVAGLRRQYLPDVERTDLVDGTGHRAWEAARLRTDHPSKMTAAAARNG